MSWGGEPSCDYTGDHQWHGSSRCPSCGARLRCACGRFVREDSIYAHIDSGQCPVIPAHPPTEGEQEA